MKVEEYTDKCGHTWEIHKVLTRRYEPPRWTAVSADESGNCFEADERKELLAKIEQDANFADDECALCGDMLEFGDWIASLQLYLAVCPSCGATYHADAEGGYGDDGTGWRFWRVSETPISGATRELQHAEGAVVWEGGAS